MNKRNINMPEDQYARLRRARKTMEAISPEILETKKHAEEMMKHLKKMHKRAIQLNNNNSPKKNETNTPKNN